MAHERSHHRAQRQLDDLLATCCRPDAPGLALALVRSGAVVAQRCCGMANLEHHVPIGPRTVFDVASLAKQFTAFAVALLEDGGRLGLDDDIRQHLPDMPDFGHTIGIRHLVHHTSGIRDWVEPLALAGVQLGDEVGLQHLLKLARQQRALNFTPGSEYLYSNTNYNLLAEIIERVTGERFSRWTQEHIFMPLAMTRTRFCDDHRTIVPDRAASYESDGAGGFRHAMVQLNAPGSSSLLTTLEDMTRWLLNFETAKVGGGAVLQRMHEQGVLDDGRQISYAFGLNVGMYGGHRAAMHSGWWQGFRSHLVRLTDLQLGLVLLANSRALDPVALANRVLDLEVPGWSAVAPVNPPPFQRPACHEQPVTPQQLGALAGRYYAPEFGTIYDLAVIDGRLVARHPRNPDMPLTCCGDFFLGCAWYHPRFRFIRDDGNARVTAMIVSTDRARGFRFDRIERGGERSSSDG